MATALSIITEAYQKLNVIPLSGSPSSAQTTFGLSVLNDLLRSWRRYGLPTWARTSSTFTLTAGTASYTMGSGGAVAITRPTAILGAYRTEDGQDVPLQPMSKDDYFALSDKTQDGTPTQFLYDPQLTLGVFYVWPVPADSGITVTIDYHIPLTAMVSGSTLAIPDEWLEAVKFHLAWRLGPGSGRVVPADIKEMAQAAFEEAVSGPSGETGSFQFVPDLGDG